MIKSYERKLARYRQKQGARVVPPDVLEDWKEYDRKRENMERKRHNELVLAALKRPK